ncbi:outer membrane lipoprotein carrier protein LolA [bacterium]|nr:outer membrane lipoprotein carrier protein LolA [bacterium]
MKKGIYRISLLLVSVLVFRTAFAWTGSLEEIQKATDKVDSISSEFTQEKHLAILKTPLVSKGVFFYQKPNSLRWEYQSPVPSVLMSFQGELKRFYKQDDEFKEDTGAHLQAMQIVIQEITNWLGGQFDKNPNFTSELLKNKGIVLTPNKKELEEMIARIELVFSNQPGVIESVIIYESKNSFTKLIFARPTINSAIDPSRFQVP